MFFQEQFCKFVHHIEYKTALPNTNETKHEKYMHDAASKLHKFLVAHRPDARSRIVRRSLQITDFKTAEGCCSRSEFTVGQLEVYARTHRQEHGTQK